MEGVGKAETAARRRFVEWRGRRERAKSIHTLLWDLWREDARPGSGLCKGKKRGVLLKRRRRRRRNRIDKREAAATSEPTAARQAGWTMSSPKFHPSHSAMAQHSDFSHVISFSVVPLSPRAERGSVEFGQAGGALSRCNLARIQTATLGTPLPTTLSTRHFIAC